MKPYPSTEELRQVFDYVDGSLYWKIKPSITTHKGSLAGSFHKATGYWQVSYRTKRYLLHRLIWIWLGKNLDLNMEIDHINRNRTDNKIENLRQVPRKINRKNRKAEFVCFHKTTGKWRAYLAKNNNGQKKYIGYYETKENALQAVKEYHERGHPSQ